MILYFKNHGGFQKNGFIYREGAPEAQRLNAEEMRESFESEFLKIDEIPNETDPESVLDFVKTTFTEKFGPDKYEEGMRKFVSQHVSDPNTAERLVKNARSHYEVFYNAAMARFYRETENRVRAYENLKGDITKSAKKGLRLLRRDIQGAIRAQSARPEIKKTPAPAEKSGRWPYEIPIIGPIFKSADIPIVSRLIDSRDYSEYKEFQHQNTEKFRNFIKALNGQYLESRQHEEKLTDSGKKSYNQLTKGFKNGMEKHMLAQLEHIYKNSHTADEMQKNLEGLRDNLADNYKMNDANEDGILDLNELNKLNAEAKRHIDITRLINSSDDEETLIKSLESLNFFDRKTWQNATAIMAEQLIDNAERNGSEQTVIDLMKKWTGKKDDMDFRKASAIFKDIMSEKARTGVRETISAAHEFNDAVNGQQAEILKLNDISPPSIRVLVYRQRELILARRIEPQSIDDSIVAEFMSTNLVGRDKLLQDPVRRQALFQAIQNIKTHYPAIYNKQYKNSVPRKVSELRTISSRSDKPTRHDEIARFLAILTLAKEAEWIIGNMDKTKHYKKREFAKELENTSSEKKPPAIDRKFRSVDTLYRTGYVSRASRGGLNGRDIAIGAVKAWAGITLFLNFMNARKQIEGKGIKPWLVGAGKMATNPYFLGGAAAIYGIDKIQKNPAAKDYFSQDAGGQERITTHLALSGIADKEGKTALLSFINNPDEFRVMQSMMEEPRQGVNNVKRLLKQARDKARKEKIKNPVLTKKDLEGVVDTEFQIQLPDKTNDRMRFVFYEKMLSTERNIRQLKANCEKWR